MKIFLTSSGLSNENEKKFVDLFDGITAGKRVAFVPTAMNPEPKEVVEKYMPVDVKDLTDLGMVVDLIDIANLNATNIVATFQPYDLIYVYGGNTFYLLDQAIRSGLRDNIKEIISGKVYMGVSAGSIIAGPSIETADWTYGEPDKNDVGLKDFKGLGLVSFVVVPHWEGQTPVEVKDCQYEIKYLRDGEAICV